MKILIIDDDYEGRKLLRIYLEQLSHKVVEARNGREGLKLTEVEIPDLIICDLFMPVMDGFRFLNELKTDTTLSKIPVITYSSIYTHEDIDLITELGATGYLAKGKDFQEFTTHLKQMFQDIFKQTERKTFEVKNEIDFIQKYSDLLQKKFKIEHNNLIETQKKLQENEEKFRNLFYSIRDLILISSAERVILDVNELALKKLFGYEKAEVLGKNALILYASKEEYEQVGYEFYYTHELIEPKYFTLSFRKKNGDVFFGEVHAFKLLGDGGLSLGNVSIVQDISERLVAEEKLRESQRQLELSIKSANIGLWNYNLQTKETYSSPEWKSQLGYEDSEIPSNNIQEWEKRLHPEDREYTLNYQNDFIEGKIPVYNVEFRLQHKDGSYRWILSQATLIRDEEAKPQRLLGSHIDITERKLQEEKVKNSYEKVSKTLTDVIYAIARIVETRDPYTAGHQQRVADLCVAIAREMGLSQEIVNSLYLISLVHDIGKIYIPAEILNRPGKLNQHEFNIVKSHAEKGYEIIKDIEFPWPLSQSVLQYHERINGSGYPKGLKCGEIILEAKILAVADVVEAMSSHRPYRPAFSLPETLKEIEDNKGILYDPQAVDACLRLFKDKGYQLPPLKEQ